MGVASLFPMKKHPELADSNRFIRGPMLFIPSPSEHIHTFSWSDSTSIADSNFNEDFQILSTSRTLALDLKIPTVDGYSFNVSVNIYYKLSSIDTLILHRDPIKHMRNGILADSQTFGDSFSSKRLQTKMDEVIAKLGKVETYPQLSAAAAQCGIEISSLQVTTLQLCKALKSQIDQEQKLSAEVQTEFSRKTQIRQIRE